MQRTRGARRFLFGKGLVLLGFVFLVLPPAGAHAFDFGGNLNSSTIFGTVDFYNAETLSLWLEGDIGESHEYALQGSYTFTTERPYLFDLDFLRLSGDYRLGNETRIVTQLGRFRIADPTGYVLSHRIDGGQVAFNYPNAAVTLSVGYTGLLTKPASNITMSRLDERDRDDDDVFFAPPRLLGRADVEFPELFAGQSLFVSAVFQEDLRDSGDLITEGTEQRSLQEGGRVDTQYTTLGLRGSLTPDFFYDLFGTLETGRTLSYVEDEASQTGASYEYAPILAFLAGTDARYYFRGSLRSYLGFRSLVSSGDSDHVTVLEGNREDASTLFRSVGESVDSLIFTPKLGNLTSFALYYSMKPLSEVVRMASLKELQTVLEARSFLRTTTPGPVDATGTVGSSDAAYLGSEVEVRFNYRPFSDLGFSLAGGAFFPNSASDGPFVEDERDVDFAAKLDVSFSF